MALATEPPDTTEIDGLATSCDSLEQALRAARLAWPTVDLPASAFAAHVAAKASGKASRALEQLHTDDLYLACACARGDPYAIAAFEAHCMGAVDDALARQRVAADTVFEIKQLLRERLLVGAERPPRIADFGGRSTLRSWLFVMATREAFAIKRRAQREVAIEDESPLYSFVSRGESELEHFKARHRDAFKQAFDLALRSLPARDQTLLRQHVLDGLTIDQLASLYRVHRSTSARSLERARKAVLASTRARLREQLGVASTELDSILRMIRSRLEVSLSGLLRRHH